MCQACDPWYKGVLCTLSISSVIVRLITPLHVLSRTALGQVAPRRDARRCAARSMADRQVWSGRPTPLICCRTACLGHQDGACLPPAASALLDSCGAARCLGGALGKAPTPRLPALVPTQLGHCASGKPFDEKCAAISAVRPRATGERRHALWR